MRLKNKTYENRKKIGVCILCGDALDRDSLYCSKCANERKKTRSFYIKHRTCPICQKNPISGDEKSCPECKSKRTNKKYVRKNYPYSKEEYNFRKVIGLCTKCGKRRAEKGRCKCRICLDKDLALKRDYKIKNNM